MTVRIRLDATDVAELDAHETALRTVLAIPAAASRDYPNRRRGGGEGDPGRRRYLESTGTHASPADVGHEPAPLATAADAKRRRDLAGDIGALTDGDAALRRQPWVPLQPGDVVLSHLPAQGDCPAYGSTYLAVDDGTDIAGNAMLREVRVTRPAVDDADPDADGPEYLLRYDTTAGRWAIHAQMGTGDLELWTSNGAITPDDLPGAQRWAAREISDCQDEHDPQLTGWRQHGTGWTPLFADDAEQADADARLVPFYDLWFEHGPDGLVVIRGGALIHGAPATTAAAHR